ncbi:ABC transporter permease subunit [Shewanella colwelliana]|uniref:ABC transporter permease subunit n=1 Tax=Shewanella colwelliana TaxID=23 RepID=UPI0022B02EB9|nr:ABC transporter permease subunit [Shewanella colwelliana]MCZ4336500.1 ABC transporter permease subunit [Shewanella colwelliana]
MDTVKPISSLGATLLVAKFELKKILFNTRGLVALAAFALVWFLILWYPVKQASIYLFSPDFKQFLAAIFGESSVSELFSWPVAEMAIVWIAALYLFPLFSISVSADQFASDRARGTFRFLTLRASRDTLFFGRFLGYMLIQAILLLFTLGATLILVAFRDASLLLPAISSSLFIFINIMIVLLPFTATMAILSLYANSAMRATIYAILLWAGFSIVSAILNYYLPGLDSAMQWVLPGAQLSMMINTSGLGSLAFAPIPLIQAAVLLLVGRTYMARIAL